MRRLRRAHQRHARERKKFKQRAVAAGTAAAITFATGLALNKALAVDHQLPVTQDADADLLANKEELAIGYGAFNPDQNRNQIPDGVELAKRCAAIIYDLPEFRIFDSNYAPPTETYKLACMFRGLEQCDICGQCVNMGGWIIVNPKLNLTHPHDAFRFVEIRFLPCIAAHYMEHGSFDFSGHIDAEPWHVGRVDLPRLTRVLELRYPYEPNEHQLPLDYVVDPNRQLAPDANDLDGDLLTDTEELSAGYNLYNPDQDEDLTPDGIELAKSCVAVIKELPLEHEAEPNQTYRVCHEVDGLEQCHICGQWIHMGGCAIVNPKLGLSYPDVSDPLDPEFLPDLALHYMDHGSFSCAGTVHTGRVNVSKLLKVLEMPRRCGHLPTLYLPGDFNKDCKADFLDFAHFADKWLECTNPNDDQCEQL